MTDLRHGDCLEVMKDIPSGSVDMVLCDPPYGTMKGINNKFDWDNILPTKEIFKELSRVLRQNGKCILFSQEPYTSHLITNAIPQMLFCYRGIWDKETSGNCLMAKSAMVNCFEDFLLFTNKESHKMLNSCVGKITDLVFEYGFQEFARLMFQEGRYKDIASARKSLCKKVFIDGKNEYDANFFDEKMYSFLQTLIEMPYTFEEYFKLRDEYKEKNKSVFNLWQGSKSKSNILTYKRDVDKYHPTQKPVLLLEDLIKTYSNEEDTVLDFTMGSGSTGVACINTNRNFIGIELNEKYFETATKRINEAKEKQKND